MATATTNRITSGAAFYGVMELTGNLTEPTITIPNIAARGFTGVNGDEILSANGKANVANWPCGSDVDALPTGSEVNGSAQVHTVGGSFASDIPVTYRKFS